MIPKNLSLSPQKNKEKDVSNLEFELDCASLSSIMENFNHSTSQKKFIGSLPILSKQNSLEENRLKKRKDITRPSFLKSYTPEPLLEPFSPTFGPKISKSFIESPLGKNHLEEESPMDEPDFTLNNLKKCDDVSKNDYTRKSSINSVKSILKSKRKLSMKKSHFSPGEENENSICSKRVRFHRKKKVFNFDPQRRICRKMKTAGLTIH